MNNTAMTPDQDTAVAKLLSRHSNLSLKEAIQVLQESGWNFNGALALLDLKERREQDEEQKLPATNKEGKSTRNKVQGSKGMELKKDAAATKGRQAPDEPLDPVTVPPSSSLTMAVCGSGPAHAAVITNPPSSSANLAPSVVASADLHSTSSPTSSTPAPRAPLPSAPGAFAVDGLDGPSVDNDDYTITEPAPPVSSDAVGEYPPPLGTNSSSDPVVAELVHESLQQELARTREENERMRMERDNVVVAQVVDGNEEEQEVDDGKEAKRPESSNVNQKRKYLIIGGVALVGIGIIVGIVFAVSNRSSSSPTPPNVPPPEPTMAPTPVLPTAPVANVNAELFDLISSVSFDGGAALQTESTPQSRAYNWLLRNRNLESYSDERKIQRYAMATFFYSTDGDSWTNNAGWLSDGDECSDWYNQITSKEKCNDDGFLVNLNLWENGLGGSLPAEIGLFPNSTAQFWWTNSDMGGTIPSEIGLLTAMSSLHLSGNKLTGTIPSELGNFGSVFGLGLTSNKLEGTIPFELFDSLKSLDQLWIHNNTFTGEFTCPSFINWCFVSCYDARDLEGETQDINSPCRSL